MLTRDWPGECEEPERWPDVPGQIELIEVAEDAAGGGGEDV